MNQKSRKQSTVRLFLAVFAVLALQSARAADITWTNAVGGDFSNPLNWEPNQVPGTTDRAVFNIETPEPYTVTWSKSITNDNFFVAKGNLVWDLKGYRYDIIKVNTGTYKPGFGTVGQTLDMVITNGILNVDGGYYRSIVGNTTLRMAADLSGAFGRYDNSGIGNGSLVIVDGAQFSSGGRLGINSGGELIITNNGVLVNFSNWTKIDLGGRVCVTGEDSYFSTVIGTAKMFGELYIGQGAAVRIGGSGQPTTLSGGRLILDDGALDVISSPTLYNELGVIEGQGMITSVLYNASGWIRPGGVNSAGLLTNKGNLYNYRNDTEGTIEIELGGTSAGAYDRLAVIGTLYAGGTLHVSFINGFKPVSKDTFDILDFTAVDGTFDTIDIPGSATNWDLSALYTTGEIRYRPCGTMLRVR